MRQIPFFLMVFLLSACQGTGGLQPVNGRAFLDSLEGPKVPSMDETQLESAANYEKQGELEAAAQIYQQLLQKKPDDAKVTLLLADNLRRRGDTEPALALFDSVLQKTPDSLAAKEGKSLALMAKGDFETPVILLEEVLKGDPTRWKSLNAMGILFTTRNMQSEAQQYFHEALRQSPNNISVLNNLGLSQALDRRSDEAIATLQKASALAPSADERKRVDMNLALVYAATGRVESANAIARNYLTDAALSNNMGLYAHLAKDDSLAKAYLNMALNQSKTFYARAWDNLQNIDSNGTAASNASQGVLPKITRQAPPVENTLSLPAPEKKPEPVKPKPAPAAQKPAAPKASPQEKKDDTKVEKKDETKSPSSVDDQILNILDSSGEKPR